MPFFGDSRVMACTRADLARWLEQLLGHDHGMGHDGRARLEFDWGVLEVETAELAPRSVALLRLPQLDVRFRYDPALRDQAQAWITHFDHHTQRGGG
jgi:hypothetical protein